MKGAGTSFGFPIITDIGSALEQSARAADVEGLRSRLKELSAYLDCIPVDERIVSTIADVGAPPPRPTSGAPLIARRILIVEDNEDLRAVFRQLLEYAGHHVDEAQDGPEGLERMLVHCPEVVIVDVGLPGMNGYEFARRARVAHGAKLLLIATTGYGHDRDRAEALAAGFDMHLIKPVDLEMLERMVVSPTLTAS